MMFDGMKTSEVAYGIDQDYRHGPCPHCLLICCSRPDEHGLWVNTGNCQGKGQGKGKGKCQGKGQGKGKGKCQGQGEGKGQAKSNGKGKGSIGG